MAVKSNDNYEDHSECVNSIIADNPAKGVQYRFTISEFRETYYIGVREWYQDFDGEFAPSNNGFTLPYSLHTVARLFSALSEVLSKGEVLTEVMQYIKDNEDE